jgi:hypothetical protein
MSITMRLKLTEYQTQLIAREQFEKIRSMLDEPKASEVSLETSVKISRIMLRSQQAFWRDLPELLKHKKLRGQWVCYRGDERLGIAKTGTELVQKSLKRGLQRGQFYLGRIQYEPTPPWEPTELEESLFEAEDDFQPRSSS